MWGYRPRGRVFMLCSRAIGFEEVGMMHNGDPGKWIAGLVGILLAVMGFFFQVQLKTQDRVAEVYPA